MKQCSNLEKNMLTEFLVQASGKTVSKNCPFSEVLVDLKGRGQNGVEKC